MRASRLHSFLSRLLGRVAALGVLLFLTHCSSPESPALFVSDRNVTALNIPELDTAHLKSVPDSLSGWQLTWNPPLTPDGWQRTYVFFDSLNSDDQAQLRNGGPLGQVFSSKFAVIEGQATQFEVPTRLLSDSSSTCLNGCRGKLVPTTRDFYFTVWAQYGDGDIGQPIRYRFYLGDEYPPQLPAIRRFVGSDTALFTWDSVLDQAGRFIAPRAGNLRNVRWKLWRGLFQRDSARIRLVRDSSKAIGNQSHIWVTALADAPNPGDSAWTDSLSGPDTALANPGQFFLHLRGLRSFRAYTLVVQYVDRSGAPRTSTSTSTPQQFTTRDSLAPVGVGEVSIAPQSPTLATFRFAAPCDTFAANTVPLTASYPNRGIAKITALLHEARIDSVQIPGDSSVGRGASLEKGNWNWNGQQWSWRWGSFRPGSSDSVRFEVTDLSGNVQALPSAAWPFTMPVDPSIQGVSCPDGMVPVGAGTTVVGNATVPVETFCMQVWPYTDSSGRLPDSLTFEEATQACSRMGATVCTEPQWQHACEGQGDSTALHYGVTGLPASSDTLGLLQERCGLFSGNPSWLTQRDPRCIGPWGVHGLAGPVLEFVQGRYDTGALFAGVPVLKGGTWRLPSNLALSGATVPCRARTYPAWSDSVSVGGVKVPRPRPTLGKDIGFRCCRPPLSGAGRTSQPR